MFVFRCLASKFLRPYAMGEIVEAVSVMHLDKEQPLYCHGCSSVDSVLTNPCEPVTDHSDADHWWGDGTSVELLPPV